MLIFVLILVLVISMCRAPERGGVKKAGGFLPFDPFKLPSLSFSKREGTSGKMQKHLETGPKCQID